MKASTRRAWAPRVLGLGFLTSGLVHMVHPSVFEPLVPPELPGATELVYVSGVAELVCALGLLGRRRWAGPASVAVLLAVWPGNFQMARDVMATSGPDEGLKRAAVLARLPLQLPMMWAAMQGRQPAPVARS